MVVTEVEGGEEEVVVVLDMLAHVSDDRPCCSVKEARHLSICSQKKQK